MGLTDKLKQWGLVTEDVESAKKINPVTNTNKNFVSPVKSSLQNIVVPVSKDLGTINTEQEQMAYNSFVVLLDKANLPGPDFFEFYSAIKANIISGAVTDEKMLYNMVYNTLKGMGLTKEVLLSSNGQYLKLLTGHLENFRKKQAIVTSERIGSRQTQLDEVRQTVSSKEAEIKKLQDEITKLNENAVTIQNEITNETKDIEVTTIAFEAAYKRIYDEFSKAGINCDNYITT